jgi:hypothetical protein
MEIEKHVAVMMSFGGSDKAKQRRSILEFLRIKENIEKHLNITGCGARPDAQIRYKVNHAMTDVGDIREPALRAIYEADVLIALINEKNANVIYELAVRNLLKGTLVLLVDGDPWLEDLLPIYLKTMGHIRYDLATKKEMREYLDRLAKDPLLNLAFDAPIPSEMASVVEGKDEELRELLCEAFIKIETNPNAPPGGITLVQELDPGRNLASWRAFYPYNCVRVRWNRMVDLALRQYSMDDIDGPPIVYTANDEFFDMINYGKSQKEYNPGENPLDTSSIQKLLSMGGFIDSADLKAWMDDQARLMAEIVLKNGFAHAAVPLRFNGKHPHEQYRNKSLLPTLVGMRTVGQPQRPHATYFLVVFVEVGMR